MLVRVYFYREDNAEMMYNLKKVSRTALDTIYELVWEVEFKNILNPGRIWMRFMNEENPFGVSLKWSRHHSKMAFGDIIQIADDFYMVVNIGVKRIQVVD
ncbi:MAG TPA: hypothetical protein VD815_01895 [Candidatus Saccharimonadales bacterium]|nr:hypothetical protein [Candidatus Saccharimonadales bacterium]